MPENQVLFLKSSLVILYLILAVLVLSCTVFTFIMIRTQLDGFAFKILLVALYLVTSFVLICTFMCTGKYNEQQNPNKEHSSLTVPLTSSPNHVTESTDTAANSTISDSSLFSPHHTANTDPANWEIKWNIMKNSTVLDTYVSTEKITFEDSSAYSAVDGIITFRGNNYRDCATYGTADIINKTITEKWKKSFGPSDDSGGCGWTGQPLIVSWDTATKNIMNLYDDKKAKTDLVEVIYPTLDGNIYFYDLEDGSYTRDPIVVGMAFKGTGSLDPRGYPLLYVGSGDSTATKSPRMYVISLIEGKVIYEQTGSDMDAYRHWFAFDSSPLLDSETDTLIWPSESGLLYFLKLNTEYNEVSGTISVTPENLVKLRYKTNITRTVGTRSSTLISKHYLYFADNGGMFLCVDMRSMELVWAQDTHDTVYATPIFQKEEDQCYIYTGTTAAYSKSTAYLQKLNAETGEIIWEYTVDKVSSNESFPGGLLASPILGKAGTTLENIIIYCIARTPSSNKGTLIALNAETGEPLWEIDTLQYTYSSPSTFYTADGIGYFILCDSQGNITLYEGSTGIELYQINSGYDIEASPVIFDNTVIVGTRTGQVLGFVLE